MASNSSHYHWQVLEDGFGVSRTPKRLRTWPLSAELARTNYAGRVYSLEQLLHLQRQRWKQISDGVMKSLSLVEQGRGRLYCGPHHHVFSPGLS